MPRIIYFSLPLAFIMLALQFIGDDARILLRYERSGIFAGEWWRILTGHLVHLGWNHFWLNVASVTLLTFLFRDVAKPLMAAALTILISCGISFCFLLFMPDLTSYVGLSGTLYGLFLMGILRVWHENQILWTIVLVGLAARMGWEYFVGVASSTEAMINGTVLVESHLFGILWGFIAILFLYLYNRKLKD